MEKIVWVEKVSKNFHQNSSPEAVCIKIAILLENTSNSEINDLEILVENVDDKKVENIDGIRV